MDVHNLSWIASCVAGEERMNGSSTAGGVERQRKELDEPFVNRRTRKSQRRFWMIVGAQGPDDAGDGARGPVPHIPDPLGELFLVKAPVAPRMTCRVVFLRGAPDEGSV